MSDFGSTAERFELEIHGKLLNLNSRLYHALQIIVVDVEIKLASSLMHKIRDAEKIKIILARILC